MISGRRHLSVVRCNYFGHITTQNEQSVLHARSKLNVLESDKLDFRKIMLKLARLRLNFYIKDTVVQLNSHLQRNTIRVGLQTAFNVIRSVKTAKCPELCITPCDVTAK